MAVRLAPAVVDALLLGPEGRRRQLQGFPVLGDVWADFAENPGAILDLLIIPTRHRPTGEVVSLISEEEDITKLSDRACSVAYLQDLVVASFDLNHLYRVLIPATIWWCEEVQGKFDEVPDDEQLARWIRMELEDALAMPTSAIAEPKDSDLAARKKEEREEFHSLKTSYRQAAKLALVLGVFLAAEKHGSELGRKPLLDLQEAKDVLTEDEIVRSGVQALRAVIQRYDGFEKESRGRWAGVVFHVTRNRDAEPAIAASVPAIKADAARLLFSIDCSEIGWAVVDSAIDYKHPAFSDPSGKRPHRIRAAFDFRRIRAILGVRPREVDDLAKEVSAQNKLSLEDTKAGLIQVAEDRAKRLPLDWRKIQPLIELDIDSENPKAESPSHPHGTHVAGIIGANWQEEPKLAGICPDIQLYDLRVLGSNLGDSEFAVTAALQFIRFFNEQMGFQRIHGVNMSLAIRHNVRNYACGRTPVCLEAEALISNGVVVVAAAGNRGFQVYQLADSTTFESYAASSITDPGNADGVITVGATHRHWPHTYGVSFFSSRGPTGDGRLKPDLLAPGEKIVSCVPGGRRDAMDGTSMAAPHVSGAAALLMARHKEFKGQPGRIKQVLCDTATDLKRDHNFQGHGMVDVLRALQSI